ncbi:MAG: hypothetical protein IKN55_05560 [Oscillospiraceae bacterium]|nr:hypothetical protein [Oscillospiraceae bacterium]
MTIYGNEPALQLIRTMAASDRLPHAALIYGERGRGRKTIARYFAMAALCKGEQKPCGVCSSCRKVLLDTEEVHPHPDFIWVEHSGKKQGFSVETVRGICKDAIVAPNDGERKVYLFADCDAIDIRAQNTLLKLTEEPPPHVLLLFTAEHRNVFLTTMLSRMMPFAVRPCTAEECRRALTEDHGIAQADAERAAAACGGNIGRSLAWLSDPELRELTAAAADATRAVAERKYYELLRILAQYEKDRFKAAELLRLLDLQVRDAVVLKFGMKDLAGCDRDSAQTLSGVISGGRSRILHEALQAAYEALQANVSTKLVLAALGGNLLS